MEIGLRGILIIVGVVVIGIILFDGYRRARDSRKTAIKMSLDLESIGDGKFDEFIGELPGGGNARVIPTSQQLENDEILFDYNEHDLNPRITAESLALKGSQSSQSKQKQPATPSDAASIARRVISQQDLFVGADVSDSRPASDKTNKTDKKNANQSAEKASETASDVSTALDTDIDTKPENKKTNKQNPEQNAEEQVRIKDEVLVINVAAKADRKIQGGELLGGLFNCGLHYGSMKIFHRFSHANGEGALMFSMANMVNPGVFDLDNINSFETPGVTFFLTLPGPKNSMTAFDLMLDTVRRLARILNAELKDETQSVLSQQTIDDYRRRIREFERSQIKLHAEAQSQANSQASKQSNKALS